MMKKQKAWMTVAAAATYLGIDAETTQRLIDHIGFPTYKLGGSGSLIVLKKELDDYLSSARLLPADQGKVVPLLHQ